MDLSDSSFEQEIERLKELEKSENPGEEWPLSNTFEKTLEIGNLEIIKFFVEKWTNESPNNKPIKYSNLTFLQYKNHGDTKTLEIINSLMPYLYKEDPKRPGFYLINEIYSLLIDFALASSFLMKHFFKHYYTREHNALYPLLEKLEKIFKLHEIPCIASLLHSDIKDFDDIEDYYNNLDDIVTVMKKLISGDADTMQLAVEIMKVLLDKRIYFLSIKVLLGTRMETIDDGSVFIFQKFELKRLFQFIYRVIDSRNLDAVRFLMLKWIRFCKEHAKYCHAWTSLEAFLLFSRENEICFDLVLKILDNMDGKNSLSLQKICQHFVKKMIFITANFGTKETMNRIWSLKIPISIKCNMLYILDASWMDELQEN